MVAATQVKQLHVIYIRTTPEKVWEALTKAEFTRQYFHGTNLEGDIEVGSTINYVKTDGSGQTALTGEVLEVEPGRRLVHSFSFPSMKETPSKVTYDIEPMGDVVKLSVTHTDFDGETETYRMVQGGWPPILSGLKTLLETGKALVIGE